MLQSTCYEGKLIKSKMGNVLLLILTVRLGLCHHSMILAMLVLEKSQKVLSSD